MPGHWVDTLTQGIAPRWTLKRQRARLAADSLIRHYEAASSGRRTQGWRGVGADANEATGPGLARLRDQARDLVRNNPYTSGAVDTIVDHVVGWGITGSPAKSGSSAGAQAKAAEIWKKWALTKACDAEGRTNIYGLQKLVMRAVIESGEVLVRRRFRRPEDELPLPLQIQVLEADFLDTSKSGVGIRPGSEIIQGVEFDAIGRRTAYWLFPTHPGSSNPTLSGNTFGLGSSRPIPASEILHIYPSKRPGQVRGASWLANIILRMRDFDEYEDATLMKQKIAACLAVITSDIDGSSPLLGAADTQHPEIDSLEPGMILNAPPGRTITTVEPPVVSDHASYSQTVLRAMAVGLGMTYEDFTGDFTQLPFSAARMSRLKHWARVDDWRWQMLVPQFCDEVWAWAMQTAVIFGQAEAPAVMWTAPPMPMLDPGVEGLAYQRNIRTGIMSLSEAIKERGYDPDQLLGELAKDFALLDKLGIILDSDPRKTTQQGSPREVPLAELAEKIDAVGGLIRAGYDPEDSLKVVGLPAFLEHLGLPPVTVQPPAKPAGASTQPPQLAPANGNGNGNRNGHHAPANGTELLEHYRALSSVIEEIVVARLREATPPATLEDTPAPAVPVVPPIHITVQTDGGQARETIAESTPVRDEHGVITKTVTRTSPAPDGTEK